MSVLRDVAAERAVLSGVCRYGSEVFLDIADFTKASTFSVDTNKCIWKCLESICRTYDDVKIDLPTILSAAKELGLSNVFDKKEDAMHLQSILAFPVEKQNVKRFAAKLRKLEIAGLIHDQFELGKGKMLEVTGVEPVSQIISSAESIVFDFTTLLDHGDNDPKPFYDGVDTWLKFVEENPVQQIGLSVGFPRWEKSIGGGIRRGSVNVIGGRTKAGKSFFSINAGVNAARLGTKVLYLDSEMVKEEDQNGRMLGLLSGIESEKIQTGQFAKEAANRTIVYEALQELKTLPLHYKSINAMQPEDIISVMRKWVQKTVGLKPDGSANDCIIVYDYLKLVSSAGLSDALREHQLLGFIMTSLYNFAIRYKIGIILGIQLNRDGIEEETAAVASGSDRIMHYCSNFTIFKPKSDEEIAEDGPDNGNRKLHTVLARCGRGMEPKDYISVFADFACGRLIEGRSKFELSGLEHDYERIGLQEDPGDDIPFA